jgi:omega-6 fatty acid desaturase (delta-12 desaturase)
MSARIERMTLAGHARRALVLGLAIFAADLIGYAAFVYGAIASEAIALKVLFSILAGVCVSLLAIVGHDAAHQSFLPSRFSNDLVGTIAFLPALHAYSLWEHHHNRVHHRYTAQIGLDNAYSPMTVEQYRAATPTRQRYYRFQRSWAGQPLFYLTDVWWPDIFMPFGGKKELTRANFVDLAIVYLFVVAAISGYGALSLWLHPAQTLMGGLIEGAVFGLVVPFLVWSVFISYVTVVQHTGPSVRWIVPTGLPSTIEESMEGTVHVVLPNPLDWLMHRVMQHQAHHIHIGVPLYRLKGAQHDVGVASSGQNVQRWTPNYHFRLTRECKLYDPLHGRWCGFDAADADAAPRELAA